jgi:hypothetical protein
VIAFDNDAEHVVGKLRRATRIKTDLPRAEALRDLDPAIGLGAIRPACSRIVLVNMRAIGGQTAEGQTGSISVSSATRWPFQGSSSVQPRRLQSVM